MGPKSGLAGVRTEGCGFCHSSAARRGLSLEKPYETWRGPRTAHGWYITRERMVTRFLLPIALAPMPVRSSWDGRENTITIRPGRPMENGSTLFGAYGPLMKWICGAF